MKFLQRHISASIFYDAWFLLNAEERKSGILIAIAFFLSSCFEYIALSSAIPFIALIIEPEIVNKYKYLTLISNFFGNPEHKVLMLYLGSTVILLLVFGLITHLFVLYKSDKFGEKTSQ